MARQIAVAVVALVAAASLVVAMQPAVFHVERSATIAAPPELVFPIVNDLHAWKRWSPYEHRDPAMKREFSGAEAGEGAVYAWDGNDDIGAGRMTITGVVPNQRVAIRLEFTRPMEATNEVAFSFEPVAGGTRVVWAMDGRNGFVGKLAGLLFDVDGMVGRDFEKGLATLASAAELDASLAGVERGAPAAAAP